MLLRTTPCLLAILLLSLVPARADESAGYAAPEAAEVRVIENLPASSEAASGDVALQQGASGQAVSTYWEHAPIGYFSLGALAVGGIFHGIHSHPSSAGEGSVSGNGSRVDMALGAAGLTAVAAGVAYLYYAFSSESRAPAWTEGLSGVVAPDGSVSASFTMPLSALAD
ncbi:MAG TPA: hypothetical protein VK465_18895 [Fibrobacteria bacterium]|nr:hypothetical protein [Fibrobacteria bacterium]